MEYRTPNQPLHLADDVAEGFISCHKRALEDGECLLHFLLREDSMRRGRFRGSGSGVHGGNSTVESYYARDSFHSSFSGLYMSFGFRNS